MKKGEKIRFLKMQVKSVETKKLFKVYIWVPSAILLAVTVIEIDLTEKSMAEV